MKEFRSFAELDEYLATHEFPKTNRPKITQETRVVFCSKTGDLRKTKQQIYSWEKKGVDEKRIFFAFCHDKDFLILKTTSGSLYRLRASKLPLDDTYIGCEVVGVENKEIRRSTSLMIAEIYVEQAIVNKTISNTNNGVTKNDFEMPCA